MPENQARPLLFLNVTELNDIVAPKAARKSVVRSWVKKEHYARIREQNQKREQEIEFEKRRPFYPSPPESPDEDLPSNSQAATKTTRPGRFTSQSKSRAVVLSRRPQGQSSTTKSDANRNESAQLSRRYHTQLEPIEPGSTVSARPATGHLSDHYPDAMLSSSLLSSALRDPTDVLGKYARQIGTHGYIIWDNYMQQQSDLGKLFMSQYEQFKECRGSFGSLILANQALLVITVLFTGCRIRQANGLPMMTPAMLQLRSIAYSRIQEAINTEHDQIADDTLLAVMKLAHFEAMYGQGEAYRVHMQGLSRMVRLRDGLGNLGMGGFIAHLLVWFDANLSQVAGAPRYLEEEVSKWKK